MSPTTSRSTTPRETSDAWAAKVLRQLDDELGSCRDLVVEIHAGANYTDWGLVAGLRQRGATVDLPAAGLTLGEQLAFYARTALLRSPSSSTEAEIRIGPVILTPVEPEAAPEARRAIHDLDEHPVLVRASDWPGELACLDRPGLYAWFVDEAGAADLANGLGTDLPAGRIYAGQAGATRWPSGLPTHNTLGLRIGQMHLSGKVRMSTFRWTLAAILRRRLGLRVGSPMVLEASSEQTLSEWMGRHLAVAVHPYDDRDSLDALERDVLAGLDPPLNLRHMQPTPLRKRLTELRRYIAREARVPLVNGQAFAELPQRVQASLGRISEAVDGVAPAAVAAWPIAVSELPAASEDCSLLAAVRDWVRGSKRCLYYLDCSAPGADLAAIEEAFADAKAQGERAFPRLNLPSECLYVGSSQSMAKRLSEHLGYGAPGTYALQLRHWAQPLSLRLEFCCARYAEVVPHSVVQALEEALWERKAPMFGRRGPR